ncbi:hypothetical protein ITJ64_08065 [Herbiconiux sp. VKM Ac-1786]|uniref:hypothetical protein n=1 Tax=Herbiconiux sp. VKM Ac-1786 TaxID=2783824 RepID=UPI00188C9089|nr:hypothetical protein [Herbiconiux sp. VKM Ac-1786]MBF4572469.1 hypothetical protein [Herbiconiux sp. VKM Ac-1786]
MSNSEVRPWWLVVARPLGFVLALLGALGFFATVSQLGASPGAATFLGLVGGPLIVLAGYHVGTSGATGRPRPRLRARVLAFAVLPVALAGALVLLLTGR